MKSKILVVLSLLVLLVAYDAAAQKADTVMISESEEFRIENTESMTYTAKDKNRHTDIIKSSTRMFCTPWRTSWGRKGHWAGIGIGYNGLISNLGHMRTPSDAEYMSLKSKSITVSVNLIDFAIVSRGNWALISGLGFEFNNFNFDKNLTIMSAGNQIVPDYRYMFNGNMLQKSKLVSAYLNIPLLMEFQFGDYNDGFINFGVIGGWRMQSHTKIKGNLDGRDKQKVKNDQHMKNFHYGVTASGGYRNVGLYVTYYPQSIFRNGEGPHLEQINIGVALLL